MWPEDQWDCSDAWDEEVVFDLSKANWHLKVVVLLDELKKRFNTLYKVQTFATIFNLSIQFPYLRVDVIDPIANLTSNRSYIGIDQIGGGRVDYYDAIDERNTLKYCDEATMLGYHFTIQTSTESQCSTRAGSQKLTNFELHISKQQF